MNIKDKTYIKQLEQGCMRSHPHEDMSPECVRKTEEAREAFYGCQSVRVPMTDEQWPLFEKA